MRKILYALIAAAVLVASAWQIGYAQSEPKVADFRMIVQVTGRGLVATCIQGCAWKELSFGCGDAKQPCRAEIDQFGVGGVKR